MQTKFTDRDPNGKQDKRGDSNKHTMRWLEALMLVFLGSVVGISCQQPIEPLELTTELRYTVHVMDQSGRVLTDASVAYSKAGGPLQSAGTTDALGNVGIQERVPITGEDFVFEVTPDRDIQIKEAKVTTPSIHMPCRDTTINVVFTREIIVECNSQQDDALSFDHCLGLDSTETLRTPLYGHDCPGNLNFTVTLPTIAGMTFRILDGNGNPLGNNFNMGAAGRVQIEATFNPAGQGNNAGDIVITGTGGGSNVTIVTRVTANAQPCDDCGCPADAVVRYPGSAKMDTV